VTPSVPAPPWRSPARGSARARRTLNRDAIVDAALRVIDAEGLDALSMRRVAEELDTGAASLYAHVSGKDELIEEVLDRVHAEIAAVQPALVPDPANWQEQLKELMRRGRDVFAAHRDLARAAMAQGIPTGANALLNIESMLALLRAAGLPDKVIAYAVASLSNYLTAAVLETSLHRASGADGAEYFRQVRAYFASLPADRFPHIVAMVEPLTREAGDERFEFGLDLLVSGLAKHARGDAGG
jgi:AcrR family transcriptional regulator